MRYVQSLQFSRIDTVATFDNLDTLVNDDTFTILRKNLKKFLDLKKNPGSQ